MRLVENTRVYGLNASVRRSKYPMSVDILDCTDEITDTTKRLGSCEKGSGHDQFLTGIIVQFDLTFTIKAWTEAERYNWLDFVSSQSTMHRITRFNIKKQCNEYVDERIIAVLEELVKNYLCTMSEDDFLKVVYNIPAGFQLTAGMTTNYRQLKTIYFQRRTHRLPEWREFCKWIEGLPHFKELCLKE